MRSVVVVLPASMWAMMPMLRVFSSEYCRSTSSSAFLSVSTREEGDQASVPLVAGVRLPAVMRECLVGLRHLVCVLALLHGGPAIVRGVQQFRGELLGHAALGAPPRRADDPAHRERRASVGADLDGHLIRRATDA